MKQTAKMLLVSVVAFANADTAFAQRPFTSTPKDTIVATVPLDVKKSMMFQQFAIAGQTLQLRWRQLSLSIPPQWEANLCDNGTCFTNLPSSGSMNPVWPGDYGLMKLDVTARVNQGTAVVRYAVWDSSAANLVDTLTWIVHSNTTSISHVQNKSPIAHVVNKTLLISQAKPGLVVLLYDAAAKKVFQKSLVNQDETIDLSALSSGMYVLHITGLNHPYAQKIFIGERL